MNIADLIAAKLAAAQQAPSPRVARPDPEDAEAIDRIDPPGKQERREASKKATRALILTNTPTEPPPTSAPASSPPCAEPRALGSHRGEMIDLTPPGAPQQDADWNRAALMPETSLCLVRDKHNPEHAWIAVRMDGNRTPILLMSLPLFDAADPF